MPQQKFRQIDACASQLRFQGLAFFGLPSAVLERILLGNKLELFNRGVGGNNCIGEADVVTMNFQARTIWVVFRIQVHGMISVVVTAYCAERDRVGEATIS
jgi:hypothetical protein